MTQSFDMVCYSRLVAETSIKQALWGGHLALLFVHYNWNRTSCSYLRSLIACPAMKSAACPLMLQGALSLTCINLDSLKFWGASSVYQGTLRIIQNWCRCLVKPLHTFKCKITLYLTFVIVNSGCSDGLVHLPWAEGRGNVIWGLNSQARCWRSSLESAGLSPPSFTPLLYTCH